MTVTLKIVTQCFLELERSIRELCSKIKYNLRQILCTGKMLPEHPSVIYQVQNIQFCVYSYAHLHCRTSQLG